MKSVNLSNIVQPFFKWTFLQYLLLVIYEMCICIITQQIDRAAAPESAMPFRYYWSACLDESFFSLLFSLPLANLFYCIWKEIMKSGRLHWSVVLPVAAHLLCVTLVIKLVGVGNLAYACSAVFVSPIIQIILMRMIRSHRRRMGDEP